MRCECFGPSAHSPLALGHLISLLVHNVIQLSWKEPCSALVLPPVKEKEELVRLGINELFRLAGFCRTGSFHNSACPAVNNWPDPKLVAAAEEMKSQIDCIWHFSPCPPLALHHVPQASGSVFARVLGCAERTTCIQLGLSKHFLSGRYCYYGENNYRGRTADTADQFFSSLLNCLTAIARHETKHSKVTKCNVEVCSTHLSTSSCHAHRSLSMPGLGFAAACPVIVACYFRDGHLCIRDSRAPSPESKPQKRSAVNSQRRQMPRGLSLLLETTECSD